jgi:hypothetical protein
VVVLVQCQAVARLRRLVGEETEVGRAPHRRLLHEANRLAAVHALHQGDLLGPGHDQVGEMVEQFPALCARHVAPVRKGGPGRLAGGGDVLRRALHHLPQGAVVGRGQVVIGCAARRDDHFAVDVVAGDLAAEFLQVGGDQAQVGFEIGHCRVTVL